MIRHTYAGPGIRIAGAGDEQSWIRDIFTGEIATPQLRIWIYHSPAVVLGASQHADAAMLLRAGARRLEVHSRPTGGGAVLAGPWLLGVSMVLPAGHPFISPAIVETFRWFGEAHERWLLSLGIRGRCTRPSEVSIPDPDGRWACFGQLSHWELAVGTRKIIGLSQARRRTATLLSSGVLIDAPPWGRLCEIMGRERRHAQTLERCTASCTQLLGRSLAPLALAMSLRQVLLRPLRAASVTPA